MIRRRAQAGAKIIVVNPDKIELADPCECHSSCSSKPGTDTALLAGVMSALPSPKALTHRAERARRT